ncbi:MAG: Jag N-terminal domain-containing protein [Candidatus Cloacimonetes bacterium]|nr:Jag N-terminal domain-containing protein [Candidatus Cloacimonadota bacterium]
MKIIERQGKSTSKIIAAFMAEFKLELDDFKFEVTEEGSAGFLNLFGNKPTKIKFLVADIEEKIKEFTLGMLSKAGVEDANIKISFKDNVYFVDINNVQNAGFIIGKDGKFLESFQHLLNQMINKVEKKKLRLRVDVDGYRARRKDDLLVKVKSIIEKVKDRGRSITMEPLSSSHRRIVHQFVEKESKLKTMTVGNGRFKRIVILPPNSKKSHRNENRQKDENK